MRALSSASVALVAAAFSVLSAAAAYATPNGDNGTVKVHDAVTDQEYDRKNNPKVCSFYLDAFQFDSRQQITWEIVEMPPTGAEGTVAETDTLTLDGRGHGRTDDLRLRDGHYKLVWTFQGEHGRSKSKVFRVDCDGLPEEDGGEEAPEPSPTTSAESTPEPHGSSEPSPLPSGTSADDGPSSQPSPSGGGDLAETGSSVPAGALAAAAASMLGAGTYLVLRRRESRSR